jgi:Mn2+/Fe2+ NRAMP family transporter
MFEIILGENSRRFLRLTTVAAAVMIPVFVVLIVIIMLILAVLLVTVLLVIVIALLMLFVSSRSITIVQVRGLERTGPSIIEKRSQAIINVADTGDHILPEPIYRPTDVEVLGVFDESFR